MGLEPFTPLAGPVQGACAFRERMLELIDDKETVSTVSVVIS